MARTLLDVPLVANRGRTWPEPWTMGTVSKQDEQNLNRAKHHVRILIGMPHDAMVAGLMACSVAAGAK